MRLKSLISGLTLLAILTALVATGLATTAVGKDPATFAEALAQAKAENKMLVIDFYTDW